MVRSLIAVMLAAALAGCVVEPWPGYYSYDPGYYYAPGYYAPGYYAPGYYAPGYYYGPGYYAGPSVGVGFGWHSGHRGWHGH